MGVQGGWRCRGRGASTAPQQRPESGGRESAGIIESENGTTYQPALGREEIASNVRQCRLVKSQGSVSKPTTIILWELRRPPLDELGLFTTVHILRALII